jgi:hypothetical protein
MPVNFRMMSELTTQELKQYGSMLNIYDVENWRSAKYANGNTGTSAAYENNGFGWTNNIPWGNNGKIGYTNLPSTGSQYVNTTLAQRLSSQVNLGIYDNDYSNANYSQYATANTANNNNIKGVNNITNLNNDSRPYFFVNNGVMYWVDYIIIPLKQLYESINNYPMVKRIALQINLFLNTGSAIVDVNADPGNNSAPLTYTLASTNQINYTNVCPISLNYSVNDVSGNGGIMNIKFCPNGTTSTGSFVNKILFGNFIVKP